MLVLLWALLMSLPTSSALDPGVLPLDFPLIEATLALPGEYVLSPSRPFVDRFIESNGTQGTFIWYSYTFQNPSGTSSGESTLLGFREFDIPNSLIIPLGNGTLSSVVGDILLSWWQSGSGMQRCYVVNTTDPLQPFVKYLDINLDNPATNSEGIGIGRMTEQLDAGTFVKLDALWQPGTSVASRGDDGQFRKGTVIHIAGGKILTREWAGRLAVYNVSVVEPCPPTRIFEAGDRVFAPRFGTFRSATVVSFDAEFGRHMVLFDRPFGNSEEEPVPIGDIVESLDGAFPDTKSPSDSPVVSPTMQPRTQKDPGTPFPTKEDPSVGSPTVSPSIRPLPTDIPTLSPVIAPTAMQSSGASLPGRLVFFVAVLAISGFVCE